jgi:hypothetical protein
VPTLGINSPSFGLFWKELDSFGVPGYRKEWERPRGGGPGPLFCSWPLPLAFSKLVRQEPNPPKLDFASLDFTSRWWSSLLASLLAILSTTRITYGVS